jgi:hypothetical protein
VRHIAEDPTNRTWNSVFFSTLVRQSPWTLFFSWGQLRDLRKEIDRLVRLSKDSRGPDATSTLTFHQNRHGLFSFFSPESCCKHHVTEVLEETSGG